ncbi:GumC family protein [Silvibacterium sp.]|uniref:GumC family protein n=1 Tax=Silvibacterium sp. TaxID=1964179 RepID=UPI0039E4760F
MTNYLLEAPPSSVEAGLTVNDVWKVFRRRRRVFYLVLGSVVLLTTIYCIFATRRYVATGIVQLQKDDATGLNAADLEGGAGGDAAGGDALQTTINLETQSQILQSDTLAIKAIEDLNLEHQRDFEPHFNPIGWVMGLFASKGIADPVGASLENSPARRSRLVAAFEKHLDVKVISGTRLLEIDYTNSDPKVAAAVVNHLIQGLNDYTFQTKLASTSEAANWLSSQLSDLRKQSEEEQEKLGDLQKQTGIFSLGSDAQGHEQLYSDVLDRLEQSTTALSAADQNRILKEAVYKAVQGGNAELLSELSGTSQSGNGPAVNNALSLIQNLRLQQSQLQQQIATAEQHYGDAYPRMIEMRASLDKVNQAIADEVARVQERAKNDYDVAKQQEDQTRQQYESNRAEANALKDKTIDYSILREEANQSRTLYEDLLRKLKEAGVLQGLRGSDISIVDPARVPAKPKKPNVPLFLALSVVVGAILGFGATLIAEVADDRLHTVEQIEALGAPLVAILPKYAKEKGSFSSTAHFRTLEAPKSAYSEAVRGLRASLSPVVPGEKKSQVVLVTSASSDEGKSITAKNLAVSMAQQGKRVLLVDADMRRPTDSKEGNYSSSKDGLSTFLSGEQDVMSIVQVDGLSNLSVLPAGPVPSNPSELLASQKMHQLMTNLKEKYEVVVIDTPPILPVVDALMLSEYSDSALLVARQGVTPMGSLKRAYHLLSSRRGKSSVGIVFNAVQMNSDAYHSYFGPGNTHYYMENVNEVA